MHQNNVTPQTFMFCINVSMRTVIYFDRQHIILTLVAVLSAFICGILIGHFGISKYNEQQTRHGKAFVGVRGVLQVILSCPRNISL